MLCEPKLVKGQLGFEVVQVRDQGPARDAGFQTGDVIVAVGDVPVSSAAQIQQLAREPKSLQLRVIDVNSGRLADVTLPAPSVAESGVPRTGEPQQEGNPDPATRIADALGISVEPTRIGARGAVKVATVNRTKPGAEAGLEPGDVIVAVNQSRISTVDGFAEMLPAQGGLVTLLVRDVRSGEEVPIQARAGSSRSTVRDEEPTPERPVTDPSATDPSSTDLSSTDRLGLSTELSFYNAEAAVKIVAVKPGSPASRAGMRPGWMILKANDTPVLHPDDLAKVEGNSTGRLTLQVADPSNDRQFTIDIEP
jgi:S1-C subfamily serine protease